MAETWYPNPSVTQLQHEHLIALAVPTGVVGHPQDPPLVYAPGSGTREIRIRADRRASVLGYGWENDNNEIVFSLADNAAGSTRVDLVVLRFDRADYSVRNAVVPGTPGAGAPAPTMNTGASGVWELPLAEVDVGPGATNIADTQVRSRAWYIGPGGYLCTSLTRPPHSPGRRLWETDTGRLMVSNGTQWRPVSRLHEPVPLCVMAAPAALTGTGGFTEVRPRTVIEDTDGMGDEVNFRFVCQTAGLYRVACSAVFKQNAAGSRGVFIRHNNAITTPIGTLVPAADNYLTALSASGLLRLEVGDDLRLWTYQDSGGSLGLDDQFGRPAHLEAEWVSR